MSEHMANSGSSSKSRWVLYFVALVMLSIGAVVAIWAFSRSRDLTLERLQEARARWEKTRPKSYKIKYAKIVRGLSRPEVISVHVKDGKVYAVERDHDFIDAARAHYYTVDGIFNDLEAFLEQKQRDWWRTFLQADFDPHYGYPKRYVRRVIWGGPRVEVKVLSFEPSE